MDEIDEARVAHIFDGFWDYLGNTAAISCAPLEAHARLGMILIADSKFTPLFYR